MLLFTTPWLLLAGLALPALYLLLRLTPPPPRRVRFPALKLLGERDEPPPPAGLPPLWLLLLRLGAVAALLLGLAGPVWQPEAGSAPPRRLVLIIDNGWTTASSWGRIETAALARLDALALADTKIAVMPTAAPVGGWPDGRPAPPRFVDVATARAAVEALRPWPWPADRAGVAAVVPRNAVKLWIADGVEDAGAPVLRNVMPGGDVLVVPRRTPAIGLAGRNADGWALQAVRTPDTDADDVDAVARDARGAQLARVAVIFEPGTATATARLMLDAATRNRVARIELTPGSDAAATVLADSSAARPRVAVIEGARQGEAAPLESGGFYVRRALEPHAEVARIALETAARDPATLFMLVDAPVPAGPIADGLLARVRRGAVVISFAGPRLAENGSALSPVRLRAGARALGGVLSWEAPQKIGGYAANGPLARLPAPAEATVSRQILAADDAANVTRWAWLADGTPLVSARREGEGLLILVHSSAAPGWSTLPLSGLFEAMLRRMLPLALDPQATDIAADKPLVLDRMLDADGDLVPAPVRATIAAADWERAHPSPKTPPGLYRAGDAERPLNLAANAPLGPRFRFTPLKLEGLRRVADIERPFDLGRWLVLLGLALIAVDAIVALALRGALPHLARSGAAALLVAAVMTGAPSDARAAIQLQLAYVATGNPARDRLSAAGLAALGRVLKTRTAVAPGPAVAVDPARDPLGRYPVIYWPVAGARRMEPAAVARIRDYLDRGGLILFDFVDGNRDGADARALLGPLGLPPLAEVGPRHVLARTFYLLERFPGARGAPALWAEAGTEGDSGRVAGTVIGSADWASAWAEGSTLPYATRELAWRFGINLVMYALTGTYKADQVHTRALLDRFGADAPVTAPAPNRR